MRKITIQPRPLSPGEISYQQRAAKWYATLQAKQAARKQPVPPRDPEDPKVRFNSHMSTPPRMAYGAIYDNDWMPENDTV